MKTAVCIGTGPSLTMDQLEAARDHGFALYACNNAIFLAPDAELLYSVNKAWWDHYYEMVKDYRCEKWTTNPEAARAYNLSWIAEKNAKGLSTNPDYIHHGHGSGYSLVSMAHKKGYERIILIGYDLKYAPDYDPGNRNPGSTPRHFFNGGEYPPSMQHWPSVSIKNGVHIELVDLYRSIAEQGLVELVNCTPGSALESVIGYEDVRAVR